MKIDILAENSEDVQVGLRGVLDRDGSRKLEEFLLGRSGLHAIRLVMDFTAVDFIGLSAIVLLSRFAEEMNPRGGEMVFKNLSPLLRKMLESVPDSSRWSVQNPD